MMYFITCHIINDATNTINLFLREIIQLHWVLRSIISD
jgi:hypothetical protein